MRLRSALLLIAFAAPLPAAAQPPWSLTLSAGQSSTDTGYIPGSLPVPVTPDGTRVSADERDSAYRVGVGYRFSPHFAVEATYTDYGSSRIDSSFAVMRGVAASKVLIRDGTLTIDRRVRGFGADALAILPIVDGLSVFGRAGVVFAEVRADATTNIEATIAEGPFWADGQGGLTRSGKSTDATGRFGLGLEWMFFRELGARIEWEQVQKVGKSFRDSGSSPTGEAKTDFWSAGLVWRF